MEGFDVFKTYLALKLHFTSKTYDYHKYEGKVTAKLDTFTKRNDRYFFYKLSKKYKPSEIEDFFVANFIKNDRNWVGSLLNNDGETTFKDYIKYSQSLSYNFRMECVHISDGFNANNLSFDDGFICNNGQHPRLLQLLIQKKISYQTAVIINHYLSFVKNWNLEIKEKVVWPKIAFKLGKLKNFVKFNETKCRIIMKEVFVNG